MLIYIVAITYIQRNMKKIIIGCLILSLSSITSSKPIQPVSDKEHEASCRAMLDVAYAVMQKKQEGMSLKEMLDRNDEAYKSQPNEFLYETSKEIVKDAFSQQEVLDKKKQLNDFSAKYYLGCMKMYE